uniref:AMP-dependent synthetase/ligase domain-containing protein n=1 Tax=Timspurckia oligopyrenoides TaxID=708627 RepID=A0A7S0ZAP9_9RHOD
MAESFFVSEATGTRPLTGSDLVEVPPLTLWKLLSNANDLRPSWRLFDSGASKATNVSEFYELVKDLAKGLLNEKVEKGDVVAILGMNCIEYAAAEIAVASVGCLALPLFSEGSPEVNEVALQTSKAKIAIGSIAYAPKIMIFRKSLVDLKKIVFWAETEEQIPESVGDVIFWDDFLYQASKLPSSDFEARLREVKPEMPCVCIPVTSASLIKMAMLSHDNLTWAARRLVDRLDLTDKDHLVSYIPFFLVQGKVLDVYGALYKGYSVTFLEGKAWHGNKSTLIAGLKKAKPTFMLTPGYAVEKIQWTIEKQLLLDSDKMKHFFKSAALDCGRKSSNAVMKGKKMPVGFSMHNSGTFSKGRATVGLDNLRYMVSFGNPLSDTVDTYLWNIFIPVVDSFELHEAAGFLAIQAPGCFAKGSAGKPLEGLEVKIEKPDENGVGEVAVRGRAVFLGYLGDVGMNKNAFTKDGWFLTSYLARQDDAGFLYPSGHKEELIVMATGERVNPLLVENNIKSLLPGVNQVCIVGEGQHSLGCLFTMKTSSKVDNTGRLNMSARRYTQAKTVHELANDIRWFDLVKIALDQVNRLATSTSTKVTNFKVIEGKWDTANQCALPGGRLNREMIAKTYANEIKELFS